MAIGCQYRGVAEDRVRTAEVVGSLCLATDLGMALPFGLGLGSTVVAMRLADRLGVDEATAVQTYYACLLFYAGCTADADVQADLFPDGLTEHWTAVMFASQRQSMAGVFRALGSGDGGRMIRTVRSAAKFPRAARGYKHHTEALCEVAEMLATGVGLPSTVSGLFRLLTERWDGGGPLRRASGAELPFAIRIVHVARDATFQRLLHGPARAVDVVRERAGGAFDPAVVDALTLDMLDESSGWDAAMAAEPTPHVRLEGAQIEDALTALAAFTDLAAVIGHSFAVAELAARAAKHLGRADDEVTVVGSPTTSARSGSRSGSGSTEAPGLPMTGRRFGCTRTTPSAPCPARRTSPSLPRSRAATTNGWTAVVTTGACPGRISNCPRGYWPRRTRTARRLRQAMAVRR